MISHSSSFAAHKYIRVLYIQFLFYLTYVLRIANKGIIFYILFAHKMESLKGKKKENRGN